MLESDIKNSSNTVATTKTKTTLSSTVQNEAKPDQSKIKQYQAKTIKRNFKSRSIPIDYSTNEDIYVDYIYPLSKIIFAEAGNMGDKHQQYVGYVVMNRVYSKYYPNSIHEVFFSGGYADTSKARYLAERDTEQAIKNATVVINKYFNAGLEKLPVSRAMVFQAEFKQGVNMIQMGNTYFGCDERILADLKKENNK